jgi:hypothetical protein
MQRIDDCTHLDTDIRLSWLPKSALFIGFKRARQLVLEAICTAKLIMVDKLCTKRRTSCYCYEHSMIMATGSEVSIALDS